MTRPIVAFAVLLALAGEARAAYSVYVAAPRYRYVSGDIAAVCGAATLGCTDITALALHMRCEQRDDVWAASASIAFVPVVHMPAFAAPAAAHRLLQHELAHVDDFHRAAEAYARSLAERRFPSVVACRAVALQEEAAFGARMSGVGRQSVALRR